MTLDRSWPRLQTDACTGDRKASAVDSRDLRGAAVDGAWLKRKRTMREGWWAARTAELVRKNLEGRWRIAGECDH